MFKYLNVAEWPIPVSHCSSNKCFLDRLSVVASSLDVACGIQELRGTDHPVFRKLYRLLPPSHRRQNQILIQHDQHFSGHIAFGDIH